MACNSMLSIVGYDGGVVRSYVPEVSIVSGGSFGVEVKSYMNVVFDKVVVDCVDACVGNPCF